MTASPAKHWLVLRFASVPLIPLFFYFVASRGAFTGSRAEFIAWLKAPLPAAAAAVFLACALYHAALGMEEIVEDYLPNKRQRDAALLANKAFFAALAAVSFAALAAIWTRGL